MHLHLNPLGGLAGDMFCAALLHARPDLLEQVQAAVADLGMAVPVRLELLQQEGLIDGRRFRVMPHEQPGRHHHHTRFTEIRDLLRRSPLSDGVRNRALHIFTLLAEAEGQVHGVAPEIVSFHEVGSWDSIADIVSAAVLLESIEVDSASCAPLPLGGGRVRTAHGLLPVPAPATAILLQGLPVVNDGIAGERVTPTGAAILKSLDPSFNGSADGLLRHTGMGFGSRKLEGVPNCLQVLCLEAAETPTFQTESDRVATLRCDIDDQSPEDFALAMDRLRSETGVLSVTSIQAIGKQGRPTMVVEILARPEYLNAVAEACFRETTTIGLRYGETRRLLLPRSQHSVDVASDRLEVKRVQRPTGPSAKVESRDLKQAADQQERERLRRVGAALALNEGMEHD